MNQNRLIIIVIILVSCNNNSNNKIKATDSLSIDNYKLINPIIKYTPLKSIFINGKSHYFELLDSQRVNTQFKIFISSELGDSVTLRINRISFKRSIYCYKNYQPHLITLELDGPNNNLLILDEGVSSLSEFIKIDTIKEINTSAIDGLIVSAYSQMRHKYFHFMITPNFHTYDVELNNQNVIITKDKYSYVEIE